MESDTTAHHIHPLVAGAGISVMLVSLTGVAAMTGMFPTSHSSSTSASSHAVSSSIGAAAVATSPAALLEREPTREFSGVAFPQASPQGKFESEHATPMPQSKPQRNDAGPSSAAAKSPAICKSCGRIESVQAIQHPAQPSGVGMVAGAVLGGVLGNQIGDGSGRKIATVAGAFGGGYAGNEVEKRTRATTTYQVRIHMDNGAIQSFPFSRQPVWTTGDRVRVVNGKVIDHA